MDPADVRSGPRSLAKWSKVTARPTIVTRCPTNHLLNPDAADSRWSIAPQSSEVDATGLLESGFYLMVSI
ncbi:hypothetical protein LSTR_LSTR009250 [Laodelphax striatellus]|uniref:Uncharacterized protein n=1 Tax=Laodelphax striatellus TaxID=195883 RepID=A0A482XD51_LAOST|nr:hypothetical protein LSTR_LSTR009250 [Laodelphax striatellus]